MDCDKLVKALRHCSGHLGCTECPRYDAEKARKYFGCGALDDAAAAIEALQADIKRLKEANDELREAQTYIDHYGDRWLTSAKDVPTAAYEHGYADGRDEAMAKMEVQE